MHLPNVSCDVLKVHVIRESVLLPLILQLRTQSVVDRCTGIRITAHGYVIAVHEHALYDIEPQPSKGVAVSWPCSHFACMPNCIDGCLKMGSHMCNYHHTPASTADLEANAFRVNGNCMDFGTIFMERQMRCENCRQLPNMSSTFQKKDNTPRIRLKME